MKPILAFSLALAASSALAATPPSATSVSWTQDASTHVVTVSYALSEAAIVTADVTTNGVTCPHVTYLIGDVNKMVAAGEHTFRWSPDREGFALRELPENTQINVKTWSPADPPDYMLVSLAVTNDCRYFSCVEALPGGIDHDHYREDGLLLRKIPAANVTWRMGSPLSEGNRNIDGDETPHLVTLTRDYYESVFTITQHQWYRLMNGVSGAIALPSTYQTCRDCRSARPVEQVNIAMIRGATHTNTWPNADEAVAHAVDANSFLGQLRSMTNLRFDLPTEAQWEYAARAGVKTGITTGLDVETGTGSGVSTNMLAVARYNRFLDGSAVPNGYPTYAVHCTTGGTARVGSYLPNNWGIYDTQGNLREWCLDRYGKFGTEPVTDPVGYSGNANQVYRGGAFDNYARQCRLAWRAPVNQSSRWCSIGFRVALEIKPGEGPITVK